jgi:predicted nuclease of predicted toxin-antitoxin system
MTPSGIRPCSPRIGSGCSRAITRALFERVLPRRRRQLFSAEHFTVDGTLIEAWAGLTSFKYDAVHVHEIGMARAADTRLLDVARREERVIVTADLDYPRLLALHQANRPGIIVFRGGAYSDAEMLGLLDRVLAQIPALDLERSIVVVDRRRIEAFPEETAPKYLLRDRDAIYGEVFTRCVDTMGIRPVITAPRAPWQNPFVERVIGSIRRECLDHVMIRSESPPAPAPAWLRHRLPRRAAPSSA